VFHDNLKAWSGDHIIDPKLVPGVLLCNRKLAAAAPHITDLAPTILEHFGVPVPGHMDGKALCVADARGRFPDGPGKPEPVRGTARREKPAEEREEVASC
jgi:hypothetical protein